MSAEFASARRKIRYNRKYFAQKWSNGRGQFSGGSVIPKEYATVIELKSGRVITSIVRSDTPIALTVITANETIVLPKKEVDSLTPSKISMMRLKNTNPTRQRGSALADASGWCKCTRHFVMFPIT